LSSPIINQRILKSNATHDLDLVQGQKVSVLCPGVQGSYGEDSSLSGIARGLFGFDWGQGSRELRGTLGSYYSFATIKSNKLLDRDQQSVGFPIIESLEIELGGFQMIKFLFVSALITVLGYVILFAPVLLGLKMAAVSGCALVGRLSA